MYKKRIKHSDQVSCTTSSNYEEYFQSHSKSNSVN